jgi:hypothetical protein
MTLNEAANCGGLQTLKLETRDARKGHNHHLACCALLICELDEVDPDRNRTSNSQMCPTRKDVHGAIWFILDLLGQRLRQSHSRIFARLANYPPTHTACSKSSRPPTEATYSGYFACSDSFRNGLLELIQLRLGPRERPLRIPYAGLEFDLVALSLLEESL